MTGAVGEYGRKKRAAEAVSDRESGSSLAAMYLKIADNDG